MDGVYKYDSVTSTSDILKKLAGEGAADGTVVIARSQSEGRGRMGRTFHSPEGKGVYLSMLLRPGTSPLDTSTITAWAAVAAARAVCSLCGVYPAIKWVNDLLLGGKKICGILTQASIDTRGKVQWAIVGVGLNVLHREEDFPPELRDKASSLLMATGCEISMDMASDCLVSQLRLMREHWPHQRAQYLDFYREHCMTLGCEVTVTGSQITGTAETIDEDFALLVRTPEGALHKVQSGEASIRGKDGNYI